MGNKISLIIILGFFVVYFTKCKKSDSGEPLPPNTEVGANTFTFRVNGKVYDSQVGFFPSFPRIGVCYNYIDSFNNNDYLFSIQGNLVYLQDNKHIIINVHYVPKVGIYKLSEFVWLGKGDYATYEDGSAYYVTDNEHTGQIIITKLDTVNKIISGKFNFNAIQSCVYKNCTSTIILDGQFDVKFEPNINVDYY